MFKFSNMSIRKKLVLMQVFTTVLVLIIMMIVFIASDIKEYKLRKVDSMLGIAQVLGTNSISMLQFQDQAAAIEMLAQLHNVSPEIIAAEITNNHGQVFARYPAAGEPEFSLAAGMKENSLFRNSRLLIKYPIISSKEKIGDIHLIVQLTELQKLMKSTYKVALFLLLLSVGFAFLVAFFIQSYVSRRLLNLVRTMKKAVSTGEYTVTIADEGKDEIGTLIQVYSKLMEQIKENEKKKDEFIGIASHELKTPLTTVKGYIEMLKLMETEHPKIDFVESAFKSVLKLEDLIKDLLDVSKIESGQLQLAMENFDISRLVDATISSVQMISATHNIVRKGQMENEIIYGDIKKIEQVLTNLLSNAIKYSPGEQKVIVEVEKDEKELTIKVRDFGIGIPVEEHSFIFERFYRTKGSSVHISGFGLGLYICRDIIRRHNGKIWIKSMEKGTTFIFSLPISKKTQIV